MNQTYLKKLEYNQILQKLTTYCHTYIGKNIAENLLPSNQKEKVADELAKTNEAVSLIERNSTPPISEIDDIGVYLKLLESSSTISAKALLSVVNILEMSDGLIEYFSSFINTDDFPHLNGYFLERGDISIESKEEKTRLALKYGVDLVIEHHFFFSSSSADIFASSAIELLNELHVEKIVFGSESNDINTLK